MTIVEEDKLKEFETWLSLLTDRTHPERHEWKAWFCVAEYEKSDFKTMSSILREHNSSSNFAFLGRDATEHADIIKTLADNDHEIAFHSHRHHTYGDLSYEQAHDAISTGMSAIEEKTGITPNGFFVPFFELSEGSVEAIEDFGFDWILGSPNEPLNGVENLKPAWPLDTKRFEEDTAPDVMNQFEEEAKAENGPFLFHPPVIEYRNGMEEFVEWIQSVQPVSIAEKLQSGGTGMILDCVRPVSID